MSAGEKRLKLLLEHTTMHDVTSGASLALRVFESGTEKPPHSCPIIPSFNGVSIILSTTTKLDCVLVIPLLDKRTFVTWAQGLLSFSYRI